MSSTPFFLDILGIKLPFLLLQTDNRVIRGGFPHRRRLPYWYTTNSGFSSFSSKWVLNFSWSFSFYFTLKTPTKPRLTTKMGNNKKVGLSRIMRRERGAMMVFWRQTSDDPSLAADILINRQTRVSWIPPIIVETFSPQFASSHESHDSI